MTTTSQIRRWWGDPCRAHSMDLTAAYQALDDAFKAHNYRPRKGVTGAYNCRRITGGTGYSLHAYNPNGFFTFWTGVRVTKALAVDVNWDTNPYGPRLVTDMPAAMIADIKAIRTRSGRQLWRWGGDYSGNKDAMHFEIIVPPEDLKGGLDPATLPGARNEEEEIVEVLLWLKDGNNGPHCYRVMGVIGKWMPTHDAINLNKFLGVREANTGDKPLDKTWIDSLILVDGPLRNTPSDVNVKALTDAIVKALPAGGSGGLTVAQIEAAVVRALDKELGFLKPGR